VRAPGIVRLRRKSNGAQLPIRDQYRVVGVSDLAVLSYSVPEIIIPVIGVFLGVIALGATVIGTLYTRVDSIGRGGFAISSLLLMAPALLSESVFGLLGVIGISVSVGALLLDLILRAVGFAIFAALVIRNRKKRDDEPDNSDDRVAAGASS